MKKIISSCIIILMLFVSMPTQVLAVGTVATSESAIENQVSEVTYNKEWYQTDRKQFNQLLENGRNSKNTVYNEYTTLLNELNRIDKKAYRSKKGYILFSPELTEEYNIVMLAVNARQILLEDIYNGKVNKLVHYYPEYKYAFIDYDLWNVADNEDPTITHPFKIEPIDNFATYDQKKIIKTLDELQVSNYYLYGTRIYFINGMPNGSIAGFNSINSIRGYFDNYIAIFNTADSTDQLISTLMHEVGHSIGNEIFTTYNDSHTMGEPNKETMSEYAVIYNKDTYSTDANNSWEDSLLENFAEDFSNIHTGSTKQTSWKGNHIAEVESFIDKELSLIDTSTVPIVKGLNLTSDSINTSIPLSSIDFDYNFYTKKSVVYIKLSGLKAAGENIGAIVYDNDGYSKVVTVNKKGTITIKLPKRGKYNVAVGNIEKEKHLNYTYTTVGDKVLFAGDINYIK